MKIALKRIYDKPSSKDGYRILVDRIWPRGVSKDEAKIDEWLKELAPSTPLRKWFGHDPEKWPAFQTRYREELQDRQEQMEHLVSIVKRRHTTLVYAAKDEAHNNAVLLKDEVQKRTGKSHR